ncbi:hypothetical protein K438DRAFT_1765739 [Mycena galopus ATCC 62051]|nr:hypothetical protein K438DRAFT_1765739 [Mycena galopus ATCC 62051]
MPAQRSAPTKFHRTITPLLRQHHTPTVPWLQQAAEALNQPMRILKTSRRIVRVAASGYHKITKLKPPMCPHTNLTPQKCTMQLHLNKVYGRNGEKGNFYRADNHNCLFYVLIPDIEDKAHQYITTPEEWETFSDLHTFEEEEDSPISVSSCSTSPNSVLTSPTSSATSSSADAEEVEQILFFGDPRLARSTNLPEALSAERKPFFNSRIADARKNVDLVLMTDVLSEHHEGKYQKYPEWHPLVEKPSLAIMDSYDPKCYPPSLIRAFSNLQHLDTHVGRTIQEFNSVIGIPQGTWNPLLSLNELCKCCQCNFSLDGYNSHINQEGCCSMSPPMDTVPCENRVGAQLPARTYPAGYQVPATEDFMDVPVGVAFCEWNSHIGVPRDVWVLLSTPGVVCLGCGLRRSFEGHDTHLKDGRCSDPGERPGCIATG